MSPDFIKRKILLLGDASVGKTSLIRRFVVDKFSDDYITTIGTKVTKKDAGKTVRELGKKYGSRAFVSSARTGENVDAAFLAIGTLVVAQPEAAEDEGEGTKEEGPLTLVGATDQIIVDFCHEFGDMETGMPLVRQQLTRAGVDINGPTKEGLRLALEYLAETESGFKSAEEVEANKLRRLAWIKEAR